MVRRVVVLEEELPAIGELVTILRASFHVEQVGAVAELPAAVEPAPLAIIVSVEGEEPQARARSARDHATSSALLVAGASLRAEELLAWLGQGASGFIHIPYNEREVLDMLESIQSMTARVPEDTRTIHVTAPMQGWVELSAPSHLEYVQRFQRFFQLLHGLSLPEGLENQLLRTVYELGHNAIEWGNREELDRRVKLTYCLFEEKIVLKIEDEGEGFDPAAVPDPARDFVAAMKARRKSGKRAGGMGLLLVRKLMDEVIFSERGNVVVCEKRFKRR